MIDLPPLSSVVIRGCRFEAAKIRFVNAKLYGQWIIYYSENIFVRKSRQEVFIMDDKNDSRGLPKRNAIDGGWLGRPDLL